MENRAYALATGLFIIVLGAALGFLGFWLSGSHEAKKPYVIVSTSGVNGLTVHSTVLYRGVQVGEVQSIGFDPSDFHKILIRVSVDQNLPITQATYAELKPQGVTGLARIVLNDSKPNAAPLATSESSPGRIPMKPSLLARFTTAGQTLVHEGNRLISNLNTLLGSGTHARISRLLDNLNQSVVTLTRIEKRMAPAAKDVPALVSESQRAVKRTNVLMDKLDRVLSQVGATLAQARSMGKSGQSTMHEFNRQTLPKLNQALEELSSTTAAVRRLTQQLQRNPQSLIAGGAHNAPGPGEPGFHGGKQ